MSLPYKFTDGSFSTPRRAGGTSILYPLAENGNYAKLAVQPWTVETANYSPLALDATGHEAGFYLVGEQTSDGRTNLGMTDFSRTYATIPNDWTGYGTILLNKPSPNMGTSSQKGYGPHWLIATGASTVNVLGPSIPISYSRVVTGGWFSLSASGDQTAALNWNAPTGEVYSAFTGLPAIRSFNSGIGNGHLTTFLGTLTGDPAAITIVFDTVNGYVGTISGTFTGLLPRPDVTVTVVGNGWNQTVGVVPNTIKVNASSHGLVSGDPAYLGTSNVYSRAVPVSIDGPNALQMLRSEVGTATGLRPYIRDYTEGSQWVRVRQIHQYYLPGVTPGVATPADIPLPDIRNDADEVLMTVFAGGSGYMNHDATDLQRYRGNIYEQVTTQIRISDLT